MTFTRRLRRRVMMALYAAMILPLLGFGILQGLDVAPAGIDPVRVELAVVLSVSIATLAALLVYVDRTVIRPLERRALEFSACLSHELRTPLAAVRGAAELLEDPSLDVAARRRFARNIVLESERLQRLATGVLDLERVDHGAEVPEEAGSVAVVFATLAERAAPLLGRKSLRLVVGAAHQTTVVASADRLHRVLIGLLENAIRHSPRNGTIRIASSSDGDDVRITIDDEGPGVPPADRRRIFSRRQSTDRGYGLGLAIVEGLVRGVGGRVAVHDAPTKGARFVVELPSVIRRSPRDAGGQPRSSATPARAS